MSVVDDYHGECDVFSGTAGNGRWVEKPCTCGLDDAISAHRRAIVDGIRAALDAAVDAQTLHWLAMDDVYAILEAAK